jgi:23S rRNA (adenine2503-C2)-methyltransferase
MLKGVNDSESDARALLRLCKDLPVFINLIPFNPWPGAPYESSSNNAIYRFAAHFDGFPHIRCAIRWPRGRDVQGACGQLAVKQLQQQSAASPTLPFMAPTATPPPPPPAASVAAQT